MRLEIVRSNPLPFNMQDRVSREKQELDHSVPPRRAAFLQKELDRVFRAAKRAGGILHIDMKTLIVTVEFPEKESDPLSYLYAPDGKENWDD